jgi:hypothetical protein
MTAKPVEIASTEPEGDTLATSGVNDVHETLLAGVATPAESLAIIDTWATCPTETTLESGVRVKEAIRASGPID